MSDKTQLQKFCEYAAPRGGYFKETYLWLDSSTGSLTVNASDTLTGFLRKKFITLDMTEFPAILELLAKCEAFCKNPHAKVHSDGIEISFEDQRLEAEAGAYKKSLVELLTVVNETCKLIGAERSVEIIIVEVGQRSGTFHFEPSEEVQAPELVPQRTDDTVLLFETSIIIS